MGSEAPERPPPGGFGSFLKSFSTQAIVGNSRKHGVYFFHRHHGLAGNRRPHPATLTFNPADIETALRQETTMAEIQTDSKGRHGFNYRDAHGVRRMMRLGRLPLRQARSIPARVEALVACAVVGTPPDAGTAQWLAGLGDAMRDRLAEHGLVEARQTATLNAFILRWIAERDDVKPSTAYTYERARQKLVGFYGAEKPLQDITPGSADDWRRWMLRGDLKTGREPLAEATVRKTASIAGQIMRSAVRHRLLTSDPFSDLPTAPPANRDRDHHVTRAEADAVLAACPDAGWRCAFALARFGGIRVPSEFRHLKLADIDWGGEGRAPRFTVTSPKTEKQGKGSRVVPLFPELEPYVQAAYDAAPEGAVYLLPDAVRLHKAPAVALARFIRSAGLTPWLKPWQNLRATAETELMERHPAHAVLAWIGHTRAVAERHYLQVTDAHFAAATSGEPTPSADPAPVGLKQPAADRAGSCPDAQGVMQGVMQQASAAGGKHPPSGAENRPEDLLRASGGLSRGPYWTKTPEANPLPEHDLQNPGPAGDAGGDAGRAAGDAAGPTWTAAATAAWAASDALLRGLDPAERAAVLAALVAGSKPPSATTPTSCS